MATMVSQLLPLLCGWLRTCLYVRQSYVLLNGLR